MDKLGIRCFRASNLSKRLYFRSLCIRNTVVKQKPWATRVFSTGHNIWQDELKAKPAEDFDNLQEIDDIEDVDSEELLQYYIDKADEKLELEDFDDEYKEITDLNQKMYFKIVDIWLQESGPIRRGHKDFIRVLMDNMNKFNVQHNILAYTKLLDCYPKGPYTGIKRTNLLEKAFQGKTRDHFLAIDLFKLLKYNDVQPVESMYDTCIDLFGKWSIATAHIRLLLFWSAKFNSLNPRPMELCEVAKMTPLEISFRGLSQMNPGLDVVYKKITTHDTESSPCLISSQTQSQLQNLQQHDLSKPLYVEGPQLTYYYGKRVMYFTLAADPASVENIELTEKSQRTTLLTDKEWWQEFYQTNLETGRKTYEGKYYTDDRILPKLNFDPKIGFQKEWIEEIKVVEDDTKAVENEVFAIASSVDDSMGNNPELLRNWITSLQLQNPILSKVTVLFRENETFLLSDNSQQKELKEDGYIPPYLEI